MVYYYNPSTGERTWDWRKAISTAPPGKTLYTPRQTARRDRRINKNGNLPNVQEVDNMNPQRPPMQQQNMMMGGGGMQSAQADFEVGRLFQRFGKAGNGNITSAEFKQMMQQLALEGKWRQGGNGNNNRNNNSMTGANATYASTTAAAQSVRPPELPINLPAAPETERIRAELNAQASSINPMAATELHMLQMNLLSKINILYQIL